MKYILVSVVLLIFFSCGNVRMVSLTPSYVVDMSDSIETQYSFWHSLSGGSFKVTILNKSSKSIYVDWKKCVLFINKGARKYWVDEEYQKEQGWTYRTNYGVFTGAQNSKIIKPERVSFVAPKSSISFFMGDMPEFNDIFKNESIDTVECSYCNTKRKKTIKTKTFSDSTTILTIRNFLTLSYSEKFETEFTVDDTWWANEIKTMRYNQYRGNQVTEFNRKITYEYPYYSPFSYYYLME